LVIYNLCFETKECHVHLNTANRRDIEKEGAFKPLDFNDDRDERMTIRDGDLTEEERDDRRERNARNKRNRKKYWKRINNIFGTNNVPK